MTAVLALDPYLSDWLDLLVRWLHVIAAIAWIGASFYFVLLDQSLRPAASEEDVADGVRGELWEVHGGGFYHVKKYLVAPPRLPQHLAWFKWEAYTTWLSGFALMIVLYYVDASARLVDPSVADLEPWLAVVVSVALLAAGWFVYDVLCRLLAGRELVLAATVLGLTALLAWGSSELFSARAAWLQVGATLGTAMAGNVFFVIIPAHWELIRAKQHGRDPDPGPGIKGKQRSVHNNYLTLPVLLTMLAGHFGFLTGHSRAWLVLLVLMLLGALARLFFNLRHTGRTHWWMPVAAAAAVVVLALLVRPGDPAGGRPPGDAARGKATFAAAGCAGCHTLADAGAAGTAGPNLDSARPQAQLVVERVTNGRGGMPPFAGKLTAEEIADVAAYVEAVTAR